MVQTLTTPDSMCVSDILSEFYMKVCGRMARMDGAEGEALNGPEQRNEFAMNVEHGHGIVSSIEI